MYVDYVMNGKGHGEVGSVMQDLRYDPGLARPFIDDNGDKCCIVNTGRQTYDKDLGAMIPVKKKARIADLMREGINSPVFNATLFRKDEWKMLDDVVLRVQRKRLRAWSDLAAANSVTTDGMSKTIMEHETVSDPGEAKMDMDSLTEDRHDQPKFVLEGVPLPITHSGFSYSSRDLAVSRRVGQPLSTLSLEFAARRVSEKIEQVLIGTATGVTLGVTADYGRTPTVYGYTNFTDRNTKTDMTAPDGTNGPTVLTEWLALRELLYGDNFFGPYMAYVSSNYDQSLDNLFSTSEPSAGSLRSRLLEIDGIAGIRRLDYLTTSDVVVLVQMTPDVARAIIGMPMTTVQWETKGGAQLNFKVMTIMVPQLRADQTGQCGIAHGTTS